MITKKTLQEHDSKIEKYFDFILESQSRGENVKELISALSQRQRNHMTMWLDDYTVCKWHNSHIDTVKSILFNL